MSKYLKKNSFLSKMLIVFLVALSLLTNVMTQVAADNTTNNFNSNDLNANILVDTSKNYGSKDVVEFNLEFYADVSAFASYAPGDDVVLIVTLPSGAKIDPNQFNAVIKLGDDGAGNYAEVVAEVLGPNENVLTLTIKDFYYFKNHAGSGTTAKYNFGFTATNLFTDFAHSTAQTPSTPNVTVSYRGIVKDSKTVNSVEPTLNWRLITGATNSTYYVNSQYAIVDAGTGRKQVTLNNGLADSVAYANYTYRNTSSGGGILLKKTSSLAITQTITFPNTIDANTVTLSTEPIAGVYPSTSCVQGTGSTSSTCTVTWTVPSISNADQALDVLAKTSVTGFRFTEANVFTSTAYSAYSIVFSFSNVFVANGDESTKLTNTSSKTYYLINPYYTPTESYNSSSTNVSSNTVSDTVNEGTHYAMVNGQYTDSTYTGSGESNAALAAILDSSTLTYKAYGFRNSHSSTDMTNYTVTQSLNGTGDLARSYERNYVQEIHVADVKTGSSGEALFTGVAGQSGKVQVTITYADGGTSVCNVLPNTLITEAYVQSNCSGTYQPFITSEYVGNVVSVAYNYGTVSPTFALADNDAPNKVVAKVIPHYIHDGTKAYMWSILDEALETLLTNPNSQDADTIAIINGVASEYDYGHYFGTTTFVTAGFKGETKTTVTPATNSGPVYIDWVPKIEDNKTVYNKTRESYSEFSFAAGDEITYHILVGHNDATGFGRALGRIRVEDVMLAEGIDATDIANSVVTWAIYKTEDLEAAANDDGKVVFVGSKTKVTPILTGGKNPTAVCDTVVTDLCVSDFDAGTWTLVTDYVLDSTKPTETTEVFTNQFLWNGQLPVGYTLVITYTAKIDATATSDMGLTNIVDLYGRYHYLHGTSPYGDEIHLGTSDVKRSVDGSSAFLDVNIANGFTGAIEADKTYEFTITGEVSSNQVKPVSPEVIVEENVVITMLLPNGWSFDKTVAANYTITKQKDGTGSAVGVTPVSIDVIGADSETNGVLVRFTLPTQEIHKESNYTYTLVVKAKAPSAVDIYNKISAGFDRTENSETKYYNQIYAGISIGNDDYRSIATRVGTAAKGTTVLAIANIFANDPASVSFNGDTSNLYSSNTLIDSAKATSASYTYDMDSVAVYGHSNWDNDDDTGRRLSNYSEVYYESYTNRPSITLTNDAGGTINLSDTSEAVKSFNYIATVANTNPTTGLSIPWSIDEIRIRLSYYVAVNDNNTDCADKVIIKDKDGATVTGSYKCTITDTSTASGQEVVITSITSGQPISLVGGNYLEITIPVVVNKANFGTGGHGKAFTYPQLNSNKATYAIAVTTSGQKAPISVTAGTIYSSTTGTRYWPGQYHYDGSTYYYAWERATNGVVDEGGRWSLLASSNITFARDNVSPDLNKNAYVVGQGGILTPVTDSTKLNVGSTLQWEVIAKNINRDSYTQTIDDAIIYDVLPLGYSLIDGTVEVVKNYAGNTDTLVEGTDYKLAYSSSSRTITISELDIEPGAVVTITFDTLVPQSDAAILTNNTYLVLTDTSIAFLQGDYQGSPVSKYMAPADVKTLFNIEMPAIHADKKLYIYAGTGIGAQKTMAYTDSITGTSGTDKYAALGLGSEVEFTLHVGNYSDGSTFGEVVIVDLLPTLNDIKLSSETARGSAAQMYFKEPVSSIAEIVEVYLLDSNDSPTLLTDSDYVLHFGKLNLSTLTTAQIADMMATGGTALFEYDAFDIATLVENFNADEYNAIRVEYLGTLGENEKIEVVFKARVAEGEEITTVDPATLDGSELVNTFSFTSKDIANVYESNSVSIELEVTKVTLDTFLDTDMDGYDNDNDNIHDDAEVYYSVWNTTDNKFVTDGYIKGDEVINLYNLEKGKDYKVVFATSTVNANGHEHYWIMTTADIDQTVVHNPPVPETMVNALGEYTITDLQDGARNSLTVYAGYYLTGPRVSGYVWNDANKNGRWDSGEAFLSGVKVILYRIGPDGEILPEDAAEGLHVTETDVNGHYYFDIMDIETASGHTLVADEFYIIQVVMPDGFNRFSARCSSDLHEYLYDSHLTTFTLLGRAANLWPSQHLSSNAPAVSTADSNGHIKYFRFWSADLHVGVYHQPAPAAPGTGVAGNPYVWYALAVAALALVLYQVVKYKKEQKID